MDTDSVMISSQEKMLLSLVAKQSLMPVPVQCQGSDAMESFRIIKTDCDIQTNISDEISSLKCS